jgi:rhodanese-related sulfurtransferase
MKKILTLVLFSSLFLSACSTANQEVQLSKSGIVEYTESFASSVENISHDWADINIEGGLAEYYFPFQNNSDEILLIKTASTSCMCTIAEIETEQGKKSPTFGMHEAKGWNQAIEPGESFDVYVAFDPMAHGPDAVGPISRSVFIQTSATNLEGGEIEIKVSGNVLYASDFEAEEVSTYENIDSEYLASRITDKDFYLLDVHIPEQTHIPGTDAFIPYDDISSNLAKLPEDKDAEIIVYCRSGSMSTAASAELVEMGYTNVKNVLGGIQAYNEYIESSVKTLSPDELSALINKTNPVLIDVHVDGPHHEHIEGTHHFLSIEEFYSGSDSLPEDTSEHIVAYSIDESVSLAAALSLQLLGYENVYHLEGGTQNYLNHIN